MQLQQQGRLLQAHYFLASGVEIASREYPREKLENSIAPMIQRLNGGADTALAELPKQAQREWGTILFELLFGSETQWVNPAARPHTT